MRAKRNGIMLAYPADEGRIKRLGSNYFVQPKLRGQRCRVEWFHSEPVLLSSYGVEFKYMNHIKEVLSESHLRGIPFDGELYRHGWSQERINSACNRSVNKNPDSKEIEYWIYDIQDEAKLQIQRLAKLSAIFKAKELQSPIKETPTYVIHKDSKTWSYLANKFLDHGYEGLMFRHLYAHYTTKRSVYLLKYKPTETDEYEILEVLEAISKDGDPKNMAGAFIVKDSDGNTFKVGAGKMTHSEREFIFARKESVKGKMLVVKHEPVKTVNQVPICAVAINIV